LEREIENVVVRGVLLEAKAVDAEADRGRSREHRRLGNAELRVE
jgi:hypothetical protein